MIIQIRGTHGSGKSTVVSRVLEAFKAEPFFVDGRKRPIGYLSQRLFVPGGYDSACGGCDSISKIETVYDLVKHYGALGNVLFEGILAQHSAPRIVEVSRMFPTVVIALTTPLDVCIASVEERRRAKGNDKPLDPKNVEKEFRSVQSALRRLRAEKVVVQEMDRDAALSFCLEKLW